MRKGLQSQCETTQVHESGCGAALFGYTRLYGQVPGGQAEYVRVPQAQYGPIKLPHTGPTSAGCSSPTSCRPPGRASPTPTSRPGDTVAVIGLGPVGQLATRSAWQQGASRVIGVDLVPERLAHGGRLRRGGDRRRRQVDDVPAAILDLTGGRGADRVVEAVGMEAHGSPVAEAARQP